MGGNKPLRSPKLLGCFTLKDASTHQEAKQSGYGTGGAMHARNQRSSPGLLARFSAERVFVCDQVTCLNEAAESCTIDGESPVVEKPVAALLIRSAALSPCITK